MPRARPGFTRRVLAFTIPAGAAAALGAYALARAADGTSAPQARTAAMLALLAVGLWVLVIAAGRVAWRIALVAAMAACVVPLLAIPLARTTFAVQLPPAGVLPQVAGVVLAAIAGLTLWRRLRPPDARARARRNHHSFGMRDLTSATGGWLLGRLDGSAAAAVPAGLAFATAGLPAG
jgi:cation-transporting ATPase E